MLTPTDCGYMSSFQADNTKLKHEPITFYPNSGDRVATFIMYVSITYAWPQYI